MFIPNRAESDGVPASYYAKIETMKQIIKNDIHLLNSKLKLNFPFHRVNVSTIKGVWEEGQCHSHGLGHKSSQAGC